MMCLLTATKCFARYELCRSYVPHALIWDYLYNFVWITLHVCTIPCIVSLYFSVWLIAVQFVTFHASEPVKINIGMKLTLVEHVPRLLIIAQFQGSSELRALILRWRVVWGICFISDIWQYTFRMTT